MARRGENIYKRKDGRWEGRYIEHYDISGKAIYRSVYAHTYAEVKRKLKETLPKPPQRNSGITVAEWVSDYMKTHKEKVKLTTYRVYEGYFNTHINPFFNTIQLRKLNKDMLQVFVNSKTELAPSTVKGIFVLLREALKAAYKKNFIDAIWIDVELPKIQKPDIRVFTKEEQYIIENSLCINENPNEIGILLCLYTGLRIGEVCGLKWEDIDFLSGYITVNRTAQRVKINDKYVLQELPPKSYSSHRKIPLPSFLRKMLQLLKNNAECKYVLNVDMKMMDPRTYQYQYKRILERCKVRYGNFHTLRHTFSVRALENGFDIKTLSEILGHADATVTLQRYAHSLDEHKRRSMERLGCIWTQTHLPSKIPSENLCISQ